MMVSFVIFLLIVLFILTLFMIRMHIAFYYDIKSYNLYSIEEIFKRNISLSEKEELCEKCRKIVFDKYTVSYWTFNIHKSPKKIYNEVKKEIEEVLK